DNITIFDDRNPQMTLAGFPERNTPGQSRILVAPWSTESLTILQTPQKLSSMITECDYLINVPVLKVHPYAGITFALKNYYGLIDNPSALHGNLCTPGIAEVYKYAHAKTKLIVGDAIFGSYVGDNTTPPNFIPKSIYIGSDPVAMDLYALYRINKERTLKNRALISVDGDGDARHISVAGSAPYNLGDLSFAPSSVEVKTL
ncbi:MAG: DUF362 domain-containing protein, partial [Fibrobacteres bacterium]|nr:DUF362 domain-containing protein [Fibrobacterota bacterium]